MVMTLFIRHSGDNGEKDYEAVMKLADKDEALHAIVSRYEACKRDEHQRKTAVRLALVHDATGKEYRIHFEDVKGNRRKHVIRVEMHNFEDYEFFDAELEHAGLPERHPLIDPDNIE